MVHHTRALVPPRRITRFPSTLTLYYHPSPTRHNPHHSATNLPIHHARNNDYHPPPLQPFVGRADGQYPGPTPRAKERGRDERAL